MLNRARGEADRGSNVRSPVTVRCADELANLAKESGIASDMLFLGMVGDSRQLLDALDVFVFPSLKEGLGVALLEAMACGLPVVATRAGGVVDIVEDQRNGLLVSPREPASIADAIASLANDVSASGEFGQRGEAPGQ